MTTTRARILLVEDNSFDVKVFLRALQDAKLDNSITVVRDGVEAIHAIREYRKTIDNNLIVVTDLNMPCMNGIDLLWKLRSNTDLMQIPVFVITTSDATTDREKAFALGVEGYICKTLGGDGQDILKPIIAYLTKQTRGRA